MNRLVLLLTLSLAAAGCASASRSRPPSGLASVNEKGEKVVCQMERPIGSNIAEMVCRTQESVDGQSQAAQDAMRARPRSGMSPASN